MNLALAARLYRKPVDTVATVLRDAERSKAFRRAVYEPVRRAAVRELRRPGKGQALLERLLPQLGWLANPEVHRRNNLMAYDVFRGQFAGLFTKLERDFLDEDPEAPVVWEGLRLEGQFHFEALDREGARRLVYLQVSRSDEDTRLALCELLAVLAELRHGAPREAVWVLDLRGAALLEPPQHHQRLDKELRRVVEVGQSYCDALEEPASPGTR
jgi:hypothetical protein